MIRILRMINLMNSKIRINLIFKTRIKIKEIEIERVLYNK